MGYQVIRVKISTTDFLLLRFGQLFQQPLRWAGDVETSLLARQLAAISIARPVFICGLARSGSTILLELFAAIEGVATHRYSDFPFVAIPYLWNQYQRKPSVSVQPVERPHRDRIQITRDSPEAMEEPLWAAWFPHVHSPAAAHRLSASDRNPHFDRFHREHLKKILLIRRGARYVAKNNYHATRIEYLSRLYPDAEFVVPIRHPLTHIESLVQQHRLFCEYARQEPRVPAYLAAAGHFEFGPQRAPIQLSAAGGDRIAQRWQAGDEHGGYALQWQEIYGFIQQLRQTDADLAQRVHIVRYEDFCGAPQSAFAALLQQVGLATPAAVDSPGLKKISQSPLATSLTTERQRALWSEIGAVAEHFGYSLCV